MGVDNTPIHNLERLVTAWLTQSTAVRIQPEHGLQLTLL